MALQPMLECMMDDISESVTNRHGQKFNFQCRGIDVREKKEKKKKKSMEKVRGRESAGRENSNKVKKVLAHQSSRPAV